MANTKPRIRWLTNVFLNITDKGNTSEQLFKSGSYTVIKKIVTYPDEYSDIYISEEVLIKGVKLGEGYELHGHVPIENAEYSNTKNDPGPKIKTDPTKKLFHK